MRAIRYKMFGIILSNIYGLVSYLEKGSLTYWDDTTLDKDVASREISRESNRIETKEYEGRFF